jgi:hypothetical protein
MYVPVLESIGRSNSAGAWGARTAGVVHSQQDQVNDLVSDQEKVQEIAAADSATHSNYRIGILKGMNSILGILLIFLICARAILMRILPRFCLVSLAEGSVYPVPPPAGMPARGPVMPLERQTRACRQLLLSLRPVLPGRAAWPCSGTG